MSKKIVSIIFIFAVLMSCMVSVYAENESEYPYMINELSLKTSAGAELTSIPENTGFIVNTNFTKVQQRSETDYIFIAVYDTKSALVSLDYIQADFAENYTYNVGFYVAPHSEKIESVKAFIWNSFNDTKPLAETKTLEISTTTTVIYPAVFIKRGYTINDDGEDTISYTVMQNGEQNELPWSVYAIDDEDDYTEGDVFMYDTNSAGEIVKTYPLISVEHNSAMYYDDLWSAGVESSFETIISKSFVQGLGTSKYSPDLYMGAILKNSSDGTYITLADITDEKSDTTKSINIPYSDDVRFYTVDYNSKDGSRVKGAVRSSVQGITIPDTAYTDDTQSVIDWTKLSLKPRIALVKTVNDKATDIIIYIPKKN